MVFCLGFGQRWDWDVGNSSDIFHWVGSTTFEELRRLWVQGSSFWMTFRYRYVWFLSHLPMFVTFSWTLQSFISLHHHGLMSWRMSITGVMRKWYVLLIRWGNNHTTHIHGWSLIKHIWLAWLSHLSWVILHKYYRFTYTSTWHIRPRTCNWVTIITYHL